MHADTARLTPLQNDVVALRALDYGIQQFLEDAYVFIEDEDDLCEVFHAPSEWTGNPYLYAVERLRLLQATLLFEDLEDTHDTPNLRSLIATCHELTEFRVEQYLHDIIVRQRLAGFYGPACTMPRRPII